MCIPDPNRDHIPPPLRNIPYSLGNHVEPGMLQAGTDRRNSQVLFQSLSKAVGGVHRVDEGAKPYVAHCPGVGNVADARSGTGVDLTTNS